MDLSRFLSTTISVPDYLISLVLTTLMAFLWAMVFYYRFPREGNHLTYARFLPVLSIIMGHLSILLTSSLAIALGMVGALSIIRFRSLTRSPLQLVALLVSLALGIAVPTGYFLMALILVALLAWYISPEEEQSWELEVRGPVEDLNTLSNTIAEKSIFVDLQSYGIENGTSEVQYKLTLFNSESAATIQDHLRERFPMLEVRFSIKD